MGLVIVDAANDDLPLTAEGLIVSNVESRTSKRSAFCVEAVVRSTPRSNLALFSRLRKLSNRPSSSLITSTVKLKCGFRFSGNPCALVRLFFSIRFFFSGGQLPNILKVNESNNTWWELDPCAEVSIEGGYRRWTASYFAPSCRLLWRQSFEYFECVCIRLFPYTFNRSLSRK